MLPKTYDPSDVEAKWYQYWLDQKFFESKPNPDKAPYTIVIPPPNVTGVLHMGHMLNNTIQDVLIRKARMEGKEACWVPGTDHASIATEAKVVALLKSQGIDKRDIGREKFLEHAWEWTHKYGGIILEQLKKLGASCDWSRTRFTMEDVMIESVTKVFVDLYRKGYIYRGVRLVNWDPEGRTAVSDEEVNHKEVASQLCYLRYPIEGEAGEFVTIATVRPETIMADSAICVHPDDERYKHLHGKRALIPLLGRAIPIIQDEYVSMEFGTGCLKITPAHDPNDYELGLKHQLPVIDILNEDGTLNPEAQLYVGMDRFAARKAILKDLEAQDFLVKVEDYTSNVGFSERTNAVIEPRLSQQWFVRMKDLSAPALKAVMEDDIRLIPDKFKNLYRHWMENVHDWCISRQLWWGQRIPAWYLPNGEFIVAETEAEALKLAQEQDATLTLADLRQDPDVVDTWFSSWLWPITVFDGIVKPDNDDINYYYPTNDLVTAPEILFFWVARMIISGFEFRGERPFKNVYLTGIVRDKQRRKMSKQLGNSPDPLDLIAQYGADGVRTGMLFSSPAGNDLLFDEKLVEQGRNFCNKIWNAFRLIEGWEIHDGEAEAGNDTAIRWFNAKLNAAMQQLEGQFAEYRMSDALMTVYKLTWDDFCSWYLEMIKPEYGKPIDRATYETTLGYFETLMKLLHPFMPFITEELWHAVRERPQDDCVCIAPWPEAGAVETEWLTDSEPVLEIITQVRNLRSSKGLSPKEALALYVRTDNPARYQGWEAVLTKMANLSAFQFTTEKVENALSFIVKTDELFVPFSEQIDVEKERENVEKELTRLRGFLVGVDKKLSNERFVQNAKPDVVEKERQKKADAEAKIKSLEENLAALQ
ncbi:valyl-tRNA synthetase [Catalinimonas alkaloidigena]|uniref:Valine--tRNA ligase n=1 Tax=Catalinimonas alkaloidigena TaxID=1075417 RepID=A0A1G9QB72_9BACT|nr:valine--tRNA ligase [Catalinimonas alkaloidigena]SDM07707.1 valyl-tRNA synthetase [Catalinimonas alkaloidigena]